MNSAGHAHMNMSQNMIPNAYNRSVHGHGPQSVQNQNYNNWYNAENEQPSTQNKKERVTLKPGQVERLVHEMELRPDLVSGRIDSYSGRQDYQRQWTEIAAIVSALPGPKFTGVEIKKRWSQLKYRMKTRTAEIQAHRDGTDDGEQEEEDGRVSRCPQPLTQLEERVLQISQQSYANGGKSYNWDVVTIQGEDGATSDQVITSDIPQELVQVSIKRDPDETDQSSLSSDPGGENGECRPKKRRKRRNDRENEKVGLKDVVELQHGIFSRIEALESTLKDASNSIANAIRDAAEKQAEHLKEQNRLLNCLVVGLCPQSSTE